MFLFSMEMVEENEMVARREREWTEARKWDTADQRLNSKVIYLNIYRFVKNMRVMLNDKNTGIEK
jgi:hypothetical protein